VGDIWAEYDKAAAWLAHRGLTGAEGDPLPDDISEAAEHLIDDNLEAFMEHVRATANALAVEGQRPDGTISHVFSPAELSEFDACEPAEPLNPDGEEATKTD
jgi:hypothetical protein